MSDTWKFSQCFGDKGDIENLTAADIISTVEFNDDGNFLATGDKGGRVVLFERNHTKTSNCEYKFFTEFQSHDAEFDYLKSLEIEEKINKIKWIRSFNNSLFLLSTNDKTIKLWKILEKQVKLVSENNLNGNDHLSKNIDISNLKLPKLTYHDKLISAQPKKIYSNAHAYHINSISINSDQETYISSDDLRINLWNLNISDESFNIVDIKPANMEELTEVITGAEFHPQHCNLFMYSSSKGTIKLNDMRSNSLCDSHAKIFEEYSDPISHNFFTEITNSIADVKFSHDGRYIVSRDYMTVKIWDLAMELAPIKTINVHEHLRTILREIYDTDAIFDKFEVQFGPDNKLVMTGSYKDHFMIYPNAVNENKEVKPIKMEKNQYRSDKDDKDEVDEESSQPSSPNVNGQPFSQFPFSHDDDDQEEITLQADKSAFKTRRMNHNGGIMKRRMMNSTNIMPSNFNQSDYKKSILHLSWHPNENSVAIAATNNLFLFSTL